LAINSKTVSAHEREHAHGREHLQTLHCTWPFYKLLAIIRSCGVVGGLGDLFESYYPSLGRVGEIFGILMAEKPGFRLNRPHGSSALPLELFRPAQRHQPILGLPRGAAKAHSRPLILLFNLLT
jgi:hypothetical protein